MRKVLFSFSALILSLAVILPAATASGNPGEPMVMVEPATKQWRWTKPVSFAVKIVNNTAFPIRGFSVEVIHTVDRRLEPVKLQVLPEPNFVGISRSFWQLPVLGAGESLKYLVKVELPAASVRHEYCFATNLYLLPAPKKPFSWSTTGRLCRQVGS